MSDERDESREALEMMWAETRVPLLIHIERVLLEHQTQHKAEHVAGEQKAMLVQEQVKIASQAMDKRMEAMNEFRGQLNDQASKLATREMVEREVLRLNERMTGMERGVTGLVAKPELEKLERHVKEGVDRNTSRVEKLETWMAATGGRDKGVGMVWGVIGGGVGLLGAVVAIVVAFNSG